MNRNSKSFLTGADPFLTLRLLNSDQRSIKYSFILEPHMEGFIGIPHGGIGMGLCIETWRTFGMGTYPIDVNFRFGGSGIHIGDEAILEIETGNTGEYLIVKIVKPGDKTPYLKAEIRPADSSESYVSFTKVEDSKLRKLPYYRNCFVCGHYREVLGLQRRFMARRENGTSLCRVDWGQGDDPDRAESFLLNSNELHPAVLTSIFDENTAWGGFLSTRSCGVSTKMNLRLMRPVADSEALVFLGKPTGVRGNPKAPRFYLAEGAVYAVNGSSNPEPVVCGQGEWLIMDYYTEQIKKNLIPADDWEWIFDD